MKELFKELHDEWFANPDFWFSKNPKNDKYLSEKYFEKISLDYDIKNNSKTFDKSELIGAIIAYDQIPRHHNRITHIDCNEYSKIAKSISGSIINGDTKIIEKMSSANWCFTFLPFRHLKDIDLVHSSIEFINFKYKNDNNTPSDRSIYKRFLKCAIRDIYELNTEKQFESQKNENIFNSNSKWDEFDNILDFNPKSDISTFIDNFSKKYIIRTVYDIVSKISRHTHIIVSVSGGVDSFVCLHMLKCFLPMNKITAVHINYNNRKECNEEVEFVKRYCSLLNVKLFVRKITEMKREDYQYNGLRDLYEEASKDIRFDSYRKIANIYNDMDYAVVLGHNKDDCFENIITNISMKTNYNNLSGTTISSINNGICFIRPLLDIRKSDIIEYAKTMNIPYLVDSTPKWSMRGKIRDNVLPCLEDINLDIIGSFFALKNRLEESENVINNCILPNILDNFNQIDDNQIVGVFSYNELLHDANVWSKIFENKLFRNFFKCNNISHKCTQEFSQMIVRFKKDFDRMQKSNIFNDKLKFIMRKNTHSYIYRTKDDNICICFVNA